MANAATLPRLVETPIRRPVALRVVPRRHRRRGHAASPAIVTIEWFMLTMLGVVMLALATG